MPKFRLMLSAAPVLAAALLATPGYAQQTAAPQAAQEPGAQEDDIVVVAQGRSQLLSTVPVAVSAVTAETLQNSGANDIRQLNQVAPSLLVSSTGNEANGSARIRGIGTVGDNPGLESSVAVFIDGVYRSRSGIGLNELGEIERVEVLRGPQGTLGGRNSSAGLITIVSKKPEFQFGANAEATYGNYNYYRLAAGITGPLTETLAARIDGVYVKRDGFYRDTTNNTDVNNRDRFFVRGQLLFNPTSDLSLRLIGDYTQRTEACCAATYVDSSINPYIGDLNNLAVPLTTGSLPPANGNNIINVLRDLGQPIGAFNAGYTRNISVSPGRTFGGRTTDGGVSLEANWDFGGAKLTSITAYREYKNSQASDTDYSSVDILYRADNRENDYRRFRTFTQEVRLQGNAFGDRLDWLVGGFYANESLQVTDNLRFGNQYGRFATCRLVSGGALAALYSPTSPGCLAARPAAFGAASPIVYGAIDALDNINDKGSIRDVYNQTSDNWALFTHNIVHITSKLDLTLGLRYTSDIKNFNATFTNDNTACVANQAALSAFFTNPALAAVSQGIVGLSCQGNSTSELNNVSIVSRRSEGEFTGTAILSYRPTSNLMTYASYSRGYKAGGFNLDRSALKSPLVSFASLGGAQALVGNLQFDPEKVNAYEIGAKYSTGPLSVSVAAFRQEFSNFQLNTFNGSVFIVQTINGCKTDLGTGPTDLSATTGACAASDVTYGVVSQGVELEAALRPARNVRVALGMTYTDAKYEKNLIGNQLGTPLDPALRVLPGNTMSNAPQVVTTGSFTWTPDIGTSGLSGLLYVDGRMTGDYNTGSDLFPQKSQDGYLIVNARAGIRGADDRWSIEVWAQNLLNKDYAQVAFNSPFQAGATAAPFVDPQYPGGRQIFSQFLAEPRTFGVTVRGKF
ncbi:MAG: TonB-dependent receptor [Pseudomonadota bacterium]